MAVRMLFITFVLCGTGWAAPAPREDFAVLARAAVPVARELLEAHGEFEPYAMGLGPRREVVGVSSAEVRRSGDRSSILGALRAKASAALQRDGMTASVLVYEAAPGGPGDGNSGTVMLDMAHREGNTMLLRVPYSFIEGGGVRMGETETVKETRPRRDSSRHR